MAAEPARPRVGRLGRALRELWPDGNPLRRTSDRVEGWLLIALCAMFLIGAPVAAVAAGGYVYGAAVRAAQTSHPALAILLANARRSEAGALRASAPASWAAPGSDAGLGRVQVPLGTRAGTVVRVWLDASGQLTGAPMQGTGLAGDVAVAAVFAPATLAAALLAVAAMVRNLLRRRRLAAWDTAWRLTAPRWRRRN